MGTYASTTGILIDYPALPQTSTTSRYQETLNILSTSIDAAEADINSALGRRYDVPWAAGSVPPKIKKLTIDLAAYYTFRAKYMRDSHNVSDWVKELKDEVAEELKLLREGEVDLVDTTGSVLTERTSETRIVSDTQTYQPFFDLDEPTEWAVPSARLTAIDRD